jgi:hypothetical protein
VLLIEQLERQALADRQALLSRGVTEELPTAYSEQRRFDAWLEAEPEKVQPLAGVELDEQELRMALGVA